MRNLSYVLLAASTLVVAGCEAAAPAAGSAAGASVGAILVEKTGIIDGIIEKAGDEGDYLLFSAASEAKIAIESFRASMRDISDRSARNLDGSQARTFENLNLTVDRLAEASGKPIHESRETIESAMQALDDLNPGGGKAYVLRTSPRVVVQNEKDTTVPFKIRGLNFDDSEASLEIDGQAINRAGFQRQEMLFEIPSDLLSAEERSVKVVTADLKLKDEDCAFFGFWCDDIVVESQLPIMVLPQKLGGIIAVSYRTENEQRVDITSQIWNPSFSTGDLTKENCDTKSVSPRKGPQYFIDVESVRVQQRSGQARNSKKIRNINSKGISVELCAKAQISRGRKRSGEIGVEVTWDEYRLDDIVSAPIQVAEYEDNLLDWNTSGVIEFPNDTKSFIMRVNYFNGDFDIFNGSQMGSQSLVETSWNNDTKQLRYRTRNVETLEFY